MGTKYPEAKQGTTPCLMAPRGLVGGESENLETLGYFVWLSFGNQGLGGSVRDSKRKSGCLELTRNGESGRDSKAYWRNKDQKELARVWGVLGLSKGKSLLPLDHYTFPNVEREITEPNIMHIFWFTFILSPLKGFLPIFIAPVKIRMSVLTVHH